MMTKQDKITNIGVQLAVYYDDWKTPDIELIRKFRDELNQLLEEEKEEYPEDIEYQFSGYEYFGETYDEQKGVNYD